MTTSDFLEQGYVVVDNVFTAEEISSFRSEFGRI